MSRCRQCDAPIVWANREGGGRIALDSHEVVGGDLQLDGGRPTPFARPVDPSDRKAAFQEHTCNAVVKKRAVPG